MMIFLMLLASLTATGCVSYGDVRASLDYLVGKPLDAAIHHYGLPDGEMTVMGKKIYVWYALTTTTTPSTFPYDFMTYPPHRPYRHPIIMQHMETESYLCILKVVVDDKNVIQRWECKGNMMACDVFYIKPEKRE
jgi:hypothetical protein